MIDEKEVTAYVTMPDCFLQGCSEDIVIFRADGGNHFTDYGIYEGMFLFFDRKKRFKKGRLSCYINTAGDDRPKYREHRRIQALGKISFDFEKLRGIKMESERRKVYVEVNVTHRPDGTARPNFIKFENDEKYEIDRVIQKCRAASTKVGGTGIRYTVQICGKPTFLFDEENGKWFVEAKS